MEQKVMSDVISELSALSDRSEAKCAFRRQVEALLAGNSDPLSVAECRALMSGLKDVPEAERGYFVRVFALLYEKGLLPDLKDIRIMIH